MNKKGFTLIELLAVVTLIVLISLLAIPKITKNMKSKKTELSETNLKLLSAAADTYIENNQISYEHGYEANGSTYCIPVQELVNDGVLNKPFKTIDGNEIDYSSKVKATYQAQYNSFSYELVDRNSCEEIIQYVNRPDLAENMIPVVYNSESNVWVKADVNSNWYNYSDQNWANAVLVKELKTTAQSKNRGEYIEALPGTPIEDSDILAHFVWIPRYKYKLFTSNTNEEIEIVFERASQPKSTGKNGWLTHPAFTFYNNELPGIWVGKYETANVDDNLIIKAGQTSWTNLNYVTANEKTIQMTNQNNIYGFNKQNTHMMKNSEWGAVAYLTNSQFGNMESNITTGNITGIYNMSGNKEFVIVDNENENSLGYALNETNNWTTSNSYITSSNKYLTRGNNSIFNYVNSEVTNANAVLRITLVNADTQAVEYIVETN